MKEIRVLNRLFDVLNQGKASGEFVTKLAELEKTERSISEGRLAIYYQKLTPCIMCAVPWGVLSTVGGVQYRGGIS